MYTESPSSGDVNHALVTKAITSMPPVTVKRQGIHPTLEQGYGGAADALLPSHRPVPSFHEIMQLCLVK